jgi:hypothetical protein
LYRLDALSVELEQRQGGLERQLAALTDTLLKAKLADESALVEATSAARGAAAAAAVARPEAEQPAASSAALAAQPPTRPQQLRAWRPLTSPFSSLDGHTGCAW